MFLKDVYDSNKEFNIGKQHIINDSCVDVLEV